MQRTVVSASNSLTLGHAMMLLHKSIPHVRTYGAVCTSVQSRRVRSKQSSELNLTDVTENTYFVQMTICLIR